ncbi:MAG: tetratricopeptide repeat protein [bacterium]|nr:MAG: tetratricopeptide repeat protein [bacterium]
MRRPFPASIIAGTLLFLGLLTGVHAETITIRSPLPPDQETADRLIINSHYQSDHLGVLQRSGADQPSRPTGTYFLALTLMKRGFFARAARVLEDYLQNNGPDDRWWGEALKNYIDLSRILPGLTVPVPETVDTGIPDDAAVRLAAYLLEEGQTKRAGDLLAFRREAALPQTSLSILTEAKWSVVSNSREDSVSVLQSYRSSETSGITDLIYLIRGFSHLELKDHEGARHSFLTLPPSSPFAPEALYGLGWALIRLGDLTGAAVRFQELMESFPYSEISRQAAVDLAVIYRDLGLYGNAGEILTREVKRLSDYRQWLRSLTERDFGTGSDLFVLLEAAVDGDVPPEETLARTPSFIRNWIIETAKDRTVTRSTFLIKGVNQMEKDIEKLSRMHGKAVDLFRWEIDWLAGESKNITSIKESLERAQERLPSFQAELAAAFENASLKDFASDRVMDLLGRVSTLQKKMDVAQADISKIGAFSTVIERIRSASPASTEEERQLNIIRENAYRGLIDSRQRLTGIRSEIKGIEGKIWLLVKGEAVRYESNIRSRVIGEMMTLQRLMHKLNRALELLRDRRQRLSEAEREVDTTIGRLQSPLVRDLDDVRSSLFHQRTARILELADQKAAELDRAEALALYTAADIEIQRMDEVLKAMQEVVP